MPREVYGLGICNRRGSGGGNGEGFNKSEPECGSACPSRTLPFGNDPEIPLSHEVIKLGQPVLVSYVQIRSCWSRAPMASPETTARLRNRWSSSLPECSTCIGRSYDDLHNFRPAGQYCRLLNGYLLSLHRGTALVHQMMEHDLRGMQELGACKCAHDLKIALECFENEFSTEDRGSRLACSEAVADSGKTPPSSFPTSSTPP
jgi:hypothetical protein